MKNLALHVLDIFQNSLAAKASAIHLEIEERTDHLTSVVIRDNGIGMAQEFADRITDPFVTSRTTRKVGLGIPLFKQSAEQTGGNLRIHSRQGIGTSVIAEFYTNHPDMVPWGDLAGVIILTMASNPETDFLYLHRTENGEYRFNSKDIKEMLEEVPITDSDVRKFLAGMITENLQAIGAATSLRMQQTINQSIKPTNKSIGGVTHVEN
jgi:hypothetical protein